MSFDDISKTNSPLNTNFFFSLTLHVFFRAWPFLGRGPLCIFTSSPITLGHPTQRPSYTTELNVPALPSIHTNCFSTLLTDSFFPSYASMFGVYYIFRSFFTRYISQKCQLSLSNFKHTWLLFLYRLRQPLVVSLSLSWPS